MSTRGLVCIYSNGNYAAASYNHSDSYPGALGIDTLDFVKNIDLENFKSRLDFISLIAPSQIKERWAQLGVKGGISDSDNEKFKDSYPHFKIMPGDELFDFVSSLDSAVEFKNEIDFAADSLFCEWCYVLDLDKSSFEVYKGFNEEPLDPQERFFFLNKLSYKEHHTSQYRPIKLVKAYPLSALPDNDDFLFEVEPPEEDE